jgi:hypothetical protein
MEELPEWHFGTAGVLCVAGPHPIPISTALRAGPLRVLFILGGRRATLARLRHDPEAALCLMGDGFAFTAHGRARALEERLESAPKVVVVELEVSRVQDHLADGRTEMLAAADWRWIDEQAATADKGIRDELAELASG